VQTQVPLVVANLPMSITEPFGQADLRDAINVAMQTPVEAPATPRLGADPEKEVFQYLGQVNRPRQIALRSTRGQLIYDFRTQRAQVGGGSWSRPDSLAPHDRAELTRLVHVWERMMVARAAQVSHD
jgi:hypothetical protein